MKLTRTLPLLGLLTIGACDDVSDKDSQPRADPIFTFPSQLEVRVAAFIPCDALYEPLWPLPDDVFAGDNRTFDYWGSMSASRAAVAATIRAASPLTSYWPVIGTSHSYTSDVVSQNAPSAADPLGQCFTIARDSQGNRVPSSRDATAPLSSVSAAEIFRGPDPSSTGTSIIQTRFSIHSALPLVPLAPPIDADIDVFVRTMDLGYGPQILTYWIQGQHDGFPNFEVWVQGELAYSADNVALQHDPDYLFGDPLWPQTQVQTDPTFVGSKAPTWNPRPLGGGGLFNP
jgi:hypothetical protein